MCDFSVTLYNTNYPDNTFLGGIKWSKYFTELHMIINNPTENDFKEFNLEINLTSPIVGIGQVSNIPNIYFSSLSDLVKHQEIIDPKNQRISNPLILIATNGGYRLNAEKIPSKRNLEIIIALADIKDTPRGDSNIFNKNYILTVKYNSEGKDFCDWFGNKPDLTNNGYYDIYEQLKTSPTGVNLKISYTISGEKIKLSKNIKIIDPIDQIIKSGLNKNA